MPRGSSRVIHETNNLFWHNVVYGWLIYAYQLTGQEINLQSVKNVNGKEEVLNASQGKPNGNYHGCFYSLDVLINGVAKAKAGDYALLHTHYIKVLENDLSKSKKINVGPTNAIFNGEEWEVEVNERTVKQQLLIFK